MATRMVWARSAAEMPVVTPSAASIGSLKAVPNIEVLRCETRGIARWSRRCSVRARQIRPRPWVAMKLIASGVACSAQRVRSPSFSRSESSTTTISRPWRSSSRASSTDTKATVRSYQGTVSEESARRRPARYGNGGDDSEGTAPIADRKLRPEQSQLQKRPRASRVLRAGFVTVRSRQLGSGACCDWGGVGRALAATRPGAPAARGRTTWGARTACYAWNSRHWTKPSGALLA